MRNYTKDELGAVKSEWEKDLSGIKEQFPCWQQRFVQIKEVKATNKDDINDREQSKPLLIVKINLFYNICVSSERLDLDQEIRGCCIAHEYGHVKYYHLLFSWILWIMAVAIPLTIFAISAWALLIMTAAMYLRQKYVEDFVLNEIQADRIVVKKYGKDKAALWIDSLLTRLEKSDMKISDKDRYEKSKKNLQIRKETIEKYTNAQIDYKNAL